MRENTRLTTVGLAAQLQKMNCLALDPTIAEQLSNEYGLDVVTIPPKTIRGQNQPVLTVGNRGYSILIRKDLSDDTVYRLARALDVRHAGETGAPLHPGAAAYYDEVNARRARSASV